MDMSVKSVKLAAVCGEGGLILRLKEMFVLYCEVVFEWFFGICKTAKTGGGVKSGKRRTTYISVVCSSGGFSQEWISTSPYWTNS